MVGGRRKESESTMRKCFVIQPFDGGEYDDRYDQVLSPAIKGAGLLPYRVDRDPNTVIPYQDIEKGIRDALVCLADISEDNPNVWFELGYSLAAGKEVIIICAQRRLSENKKFPFDVQHRSIVVYNTRSPNDFEKLKEEVKSRLQAATEREEKRETISSTSMIKETEGLSPHEIAALSFIFGGMVSDGLGMTASYLCDQMEKAGYTRVAVGLSVKSLERKKLVSSQECKGEYGEPYILYSLTRDGEEWMLRNESKFKLREEPKPNPRRSTEEATADDLPF
jgi:DNA-binding MarR family transcriptional regulator